MFSETAIRVSQLSKCYAIYSRPRDRLLQMLFGGKKQFYREFWALRDVSFEVRRGETVGIIGRNGAGKSTLLQMLCGTLEPSSGVVDVGGRVAALLELGAGFNPDFTGRENVFLNAMLYGLRHDEIRAKFDDIAAFADIGTFIEQPVKTYSTGMFVRLAFAIQVHLDPDIFIIDEALAVGDQRFVQKCYRKLEELKQGGTSLLFVSHDTTAVKMLCDRAIWLHDGKVQVSGDTSLVVDKYRNWSDGMLDLSDPGQASSSAEMTSRLTVDSIILATGEGQETSAFVHGAIAKLVIQVTNRRMPPQSRLRVGFSIRNNRGVELCGSNTQDCGTSFNAPDSGMSLGLEVRFRLPLLAAGPYTISLNVDACQQDEIWAAEIFLPDHLVIHVDEKVKVHTLVGLEAEYRVIPQQTQALVHE